MEKKVIIVMVNYNGMQYFEEFFKSVAEQKYRNIEIVVVDNNSADSSVEWIKNSRYSVFLIESDVNLGFGGGSNLGISYAISRKAEYVLLLNGDTVLDRDLVSELVKHADENTVTTALTYCGDKEEPSLWYAGGTVDFETAKVDQLLYKEDIRDVRKKVSFISGCCMLVHRSIFDRVGFFDEDFFLYYEDVDFCVRLSKSNIMMKYITTSHLWHKVGGSSIGGDEMSCSTQYYTIRNRLLLTEKYPELFNSNLQILRKIFEERNFFVGSNDEKYEIYAKTAIADFMRSSYGKGYYGKYLLEEYFYIESGFYEREADDEKYWYCAKDVQSDIYIVNPKRKNLEYKVSLYVAKPIYDKDEVLLVELDNQEIGKYQMNSDMHLNHIEFTALVASEGKKKLHFTLYGDDIKKIERSDGGLVYYQLFNLQVKEEEK